MIELRDNRVQLEPIIQPSILIVIGIKYSIKWYLDD